MFASLTKRLPSIKLALLNGSTSGREEGAVLQCGAAPASTPSMLGLLPAIQPVFSDEPGLVEYSPTVASCLMRGMPSFGFGGAALESGRQGAAPQWQNACAVHVAVVTPGRLVHHLQRLGDGWLRQLNFLVRCPHTCGRGSARALLEMVSDEKR